MRLVADRFVVYEDGRAIDAATAMRVVLIVTRADRMAEWTDRCDAMQRIRHQAIAPLIDFGPVGRSERFEAWQCGPHWTGAAAAGASARAAACDFLRAEGFAAAAEDMAVHVRHGAPVVIPTGAVAAACVSGPATAAVAMPIDRRGLHAIDRPPVAALAEMFGDFAAPRPHAAALWGPPGSGKTFIVLELARLARLNGFVPVAARLLGTPCRGLWQARTLFVVDDGEGGVWSALMDAAIQTSLPHAVLTIGSEEVRGIDGMPVGAVSASALTDAIRPRAMTPDVERLVASAAGRARGLPGRFVQLLWPAMMRADARPPARALDRVAEQAAVYGGGERAQPAPASGRPGAWPRPGELALLRRRVAESLQHLARGRHTRGVRGLRQAIGRLARRDSWSDAARAGTALADVLRRRGQVRQARAALDEARHHAVRSGDTGLVADVAVATGETWIDAGRPDEAEAVLGAAITACGAATEGDRRARAVLAMSRCLFRRGRYGEASAALDGLDGGQLDESLALRRRRLAALVAAGRGDYPAALRIANDAIDALRPETDPAWRAAVQHTTAVVHLAAGDAPVAASYALAAIRDARRGHDPLRAVRARIVGAEAERRRGRTAVAMAKLRKLSRLEAALPPFVQAELQAMTLLAAGGDAAIEEARTLAARTNQPALALLVPVASRPASDPVVDHIVAIVRACQSAGDELTVLREVTARVRADVHAAAVAFVVVEADRLDVQSSDGVRPDIDVARRAIDLSLPIAPQCQGDRLVAAAPIQYGGDTIGALTARWALGSTSDLSHASAVLTTSAVAAAPILWAAMARRARVAAVGAGDLIGATPLMEQVRRQIDWAAGAPFPVLVEGPIGR